MPLNYDPAEMRALVAELRRIREAGGLDGEERPTCPRCEATMTLREVPPREEVAYVRDRLWLSCSSCGRNAVVDRRSLDR